MEFESSWVGVRNSQDEAALAADLITDRLAAGRSPGTANEHVFAVGGTELQVDAAGRRRDRERSVERRRDPPGPGTRVRDVDAQSLRCRLRPWIEHVGASGIERDLRRPEAR